MVTLRCLEVIRVSLLLEVTVLWGYQLGTSNLGTIVRWVASRRRRGCCTVATLLAEHAQLHQLAKQLLIE